MAPAPASSPAGTALLAGSQDLRVRMSDPGRRWFLTHTHSGTRAAPAAGLGLAAVEADAIDVSISQPTDLGAGAPATDTRGQAINASGEIAGTRAAPNSRAMRSAGGPTARRWCCTRPPPPAKPGPTI